MSNDTIISCPVCHTDMPMAMIFCNEEARRTFTRLAVLSIPLGSRVMRYLTMFTPPKTRLTQGKQLKLIEQLLPDLERKAITVQGLDWQAPLDIWSTAFEKMFAALDSGSLSLPLANHNYLYSTVRDLSNKAAARVEAKAEQDKRNTPQRGPVQISGGATSISEALAGKDPALAALDASTRNAAKPSDEVRARIAQITGRSAK